MTLREILLWFGGAQAVVVGLLAFAGKVWIDRTGTRLRAKFDTQIESFRAGNAEDRQRLQHLLDRELHVHALQFEKELSVYEKIWKTLIDVAKAVTQLRPVFDQYDQSESEDDRKNIRLSRLADAGQRFLDQVNEERPVYSQSVYDKLMALQSTVFTESLEYQYVDQDKHREYWEKALENSKLIHTQINDACEAIRSRVGVIAPI